MNGVDPILLRRMERAAAAAGAIVAGLGIAVLIGWVLDIQLLKHVAPGLPSMKINTAVALTLCGIALVIRSRSEYETRSDRLADFLAIFAALIGFLTLFEYASGIDLRIDLIFGRDELTTTATHAGRMSVATASCIALIASAIALVDTATRTSQVLSIIGLLGAMLGLIAYAYGIQVLRGIAPYATMALHTAAGLCILAIGHLMVRPRRCVHSLLTRNTVGGTTARRLLPATVLVPLVVGWLRLRGQQLGYYDTEFGLALFALSTIIILTALVWWNASQMDASDARRRNIEADRDDLLSREQLARQRAETAIGARDQFLSVVSHELRTPLTPVLLITTALERRADLPPDAAEDIAAVREQIQIEARLIDDLLDLVRLGQNKMILRPQACDLHEIVRKATSLFGRSYGEKGVDLQLNLDATRSVIRADPDRMQQVIRNVLDNALKFTPVGGKVTVCSRDDAAAAAAAPTASPSSSNGHPPAPPFVVLTIADTGIGMSAAEIARIFDPFEQGDPSTTRKFSGLGIGLTISRKLADLHGGTLDAQSPGANRGSTFTLRLPLPAEQVARDAQQGQVPPSTAMTSAIAATTADRPGSLRILIVEDNAETVRALDRLLRSHGHQTAIAGSAQQALSIIDTRPIDLVISDIGLPDVSGWELMRSLRESGRPIRGIALSGFVTEEDRRRSLEVGYVEHLSKPIELNRLMAAIESAMAAHATASVPRSEVLS